MNTLAGGLILPLHLADPHPGNILIGMGELVSDAWRTELWISGNGTAGRTPKALFASWPFCCRGALQTLMKNGFMHILH